MTPSRKTRRRASASQPGLAAVHLEIVAGPGQGARWEVPEGALQLGRASTCDVRIDSEAASRHHATLFRQADAIVLRDEDSHNGTFVNEEEIREDTELMAGDRIQIGDSVLCLIVDGAGERSDAAAGPAGSGDEGEAAGARAKAIARWLLALLLSIAGGTLLFIYLLPRLGLVGQPAGAGAPIQQALPAAQPEVPAPPTAPAGQGMAVPTPPMQAPPVPVAAPAAAAASMAAEHALPAPATPAPEVPAAALPPPVSAAEVYRRSGGRVSARKQEEEARRHSSRASRSREERRARKLYLQGEIERAIEVAEEVGAARLVGQLKNFQKAEGAARAAFSFKKGTEAIQHYEEAFAIDEEICAGGQADLASVPGRRVSKALSHLYQQAGEAFLKRDRARAETFFERALDYDGANVRAREMLKKLQSADR